jgi:SAM-dependent methyltransferase
MPPSTTSTVASPGSAERWGPLWGARADDWALSELQQLPGYLEAAARVGLSPGQRVLDVGCGAGVFLHLVEEFGAVPFGIDASSELLSVARTRVPSADIRLGDMQFLPYEDDSFDVVTGFTSFFFAADMVAALREAGRVARTGAPVLIQVWGRPERNDLEAMKVIVRPFLGASSTAPPPLYKPGVLEEIAVAGGLEPRLTFDHGFAYTYRDAAELGSLLLAPAGLSVLIGPEHEAEVRDQIVEAMAPFRQADGSYVLENEMHYLVAGAP